MAAPLRPGPEMLPFFTELLCWRRCRLNKTQTFWNGSTNRAYKSAFKISLTELEHTALLEFSLLQSHCPTCHTCPHMYCIVWCRLVHWCSAESHFSDSTLPVLCYLCFLPVARISVFWKIFCLSVWSVWFFWFFGLACCLAVFLMFCCLVWVRRILFRPSLFAWYTRIFFALFCFVFCLLLCFGLFFVGGVAAAGSAANISFFFRIAFCKDTLWLVSFFALFLSVAGSFGRFAAFIVLSICRNLQRPEPPACAVSQILPYRSKRCSKEGTVEWKEWNEWKDSEKMC